MNDCFLDMQPRPGEALVRFVGDVIRFELCTSGVGGESGLRARLRTTLGRGGELRREIHAAHFHKLPVAGKAWRDLEMAPVGKHRWAIDVPLAEVGFFGAKVYLTDDADRQHWPEGRDVGISVQPDWCRTANTIYCAFPRMFGPNKSKVKTINKTEEAKWKRLDERGYTIIPPSGKLRDVVAELPHIFDDLGCRVLHLLPVSPTPTTMAKFGRFGSPYAVQDLSAIDPALVDFDQRTTGIEQFRELTDAVHVRGGRVILDLVINHTGWGANIFEDHPEWFLKDDDGQYVSPGAWGTTWEDLVELKMHSAELWEYLAGVFLTWCQRGVDGFRCDAGYKVPTLVWQYITARVHEAFPDTVFLLEGLGGGWEDTEIRLTEGGMQWAYSELFQNYSPTEVSHYLGHSLEQSRSCGLLVNYSETHDNDRLAKKGRGWSLLRNRLCALTSVSGGFGFTNGVEWLAPEQVNVHSARGLAWGNPNNIIPELKRLNQLLAGHSCFFESCEIRCISGPDEPVLAVLRKSSVTETALLVLINLDVNDSASFEFDEEALCSSCEEGMEAGAGGGEGVSRLVDAIKKEIAIDLLTGEKARFCPTVNAGTVQLPAGESVCLAADRMPNGEHGNSYREARARAALAFKIALESGDEMAATKSSWKELSDSVDSDLESVVSAMAGGEAVQYPRIVSWRLLDVDRVVPIPPKHWLVVRMKQKFTWELKFVDQEGICRGTSVRTQDGFAGVVPPGLGRGNARLEICAFGKRVERHVGDVRFLNESPVWLGELIGETSLNHFAADRTVLLTNGRGAMARMNVDLGRVRSKYDCVLGANLDPELPVDRHVFIKRLRLWANADGFVSALTADNLIHFSPGPPAVWRFRVQAGDGRLVFVRMGVELLPGENSVQLVFLREHTEISPSGSSTAKNVLPFRITARFDLEDRNFHWETARNDAAGHHFLNNTSQLIDGIGFKFLPAKDRQLVVVSSAGAYHPEPEWSEGLPHPLEASRGQTGQGDGWSPGWFNVPLADDGDSMMLTASAEVSFSATRKHQAATQVKAADFQEKASEALASVDTFSAQLHRAAEQFIVRRGDFKSVIAGYPWFLDWGRDTLICARGLIAGGWVEEVKQLLIVFGRFEESGTLPNTIHGADASNRDTSDAPLWYGVVAEELAEAMGDAVHAMKVDQARTVGDVLRSIAVGYLKGTSNGIRVDHESGLVWSPSHFTWMDTNYPAGTPREGYPIEIQALWIRFLRLLEKIGVPREGTDWSTRADLAVASLKQLYWSEEKGWFADSIIAKSGEPARGGIVDQALRSNCLIPISFGLLDGENAMRCVEAARRYLVVPGGLRSLAPLPVEPPLPVHGNDGQLLNDPNNPYWGRYEGDEDTRRKPAYHNGTVWTWTFPTFCEALAKVYGNELNAVDASRAYLGSMDALLNEGCFGQIPENLDGDAPHAQRGCDAQAWGVTEALRVWKKLGQAVETAGTQ